MVTFVSGMVAVTVTVEVLGGRGKNIVFSPQPAKARMPARVISKSAVSRFRLRPPSRKKNGMPRAVAQSADRFLPGWIKLALVEVEIARFDVPLEPFRVTVAGVNEHDTPAVALHAS